MEHNAYNDNNETMQRYGQVVWTHWTQWENPNDVIGENPPSLRRVDIRHPCTQGRPGHTHRSPSPHTYNFSQAFRIVIK